MTDQQRQLADPDAERATLGAMLLSAQIADQVSELLIPDDFWHPGHGVIYLAIVRAMMLGNPTDPTAIVSALVDSGDVRRAGGTEYVHELVQAAPLPASGPWHARQVADWAVLRRLNEAAVRIQTQITAAAAGAGRDVAEIVNDAQAAIHAATVARDATSTAVAIGDLFDPLLTEIKDAQVSGRRVGLSTGLGSLDDVLGGLVAGQLVVVAARPSMGKSTLAVDFARAASRRDHPCLVVSLEMAPGELMRRIIAAEARVDLARLMRNRLDPGDWSRVTAIRDQILGRPFHIERPARADLATIRSLARRHQQRLGLELLIVDYLQLMSGATRTTNRTTEVGEISRGLKLLAGELQVPVVVAAQLNRGPEARTDKRPQLSDLRESGSIEADADIVILMHRPDYYDNESPRSGEADLIVAKNRNGPTDTVTVAAQLAHSRFVDMAIGM